MSKSKQYRNPVSLELVLARVFGWLWFFALAWFSFAWIIDDLPASWDDHKFGLTILAIICTIFIGSAETRAAKEFADFELKMQKIISSQSRELT